jgi:hypothetical protein
LQLSFVLLLRINLTILLFKEAEGGGRRSLPAQKTLASWWMGEKARPAKTLHFAQEFGHNTSFRDRVHLNWFKEVFKSYSIVPSWERLCQF